MPIHRGKDSNGCYYQWGGHGKRYYYTAGNVSSREAAYKKAETQARAVYAHGYGRK